MATERSLYDRLGGEAALMSVVVLFYERVRADPLVSGYFDGLDMRAQVDKLLGFLSRAFDGPVEYRGRDLQSAHAAVVARGVGAAHFDRMIELLEQTLTELAIERALIDAALAIVEATRSRVLGGTP